MIEKKDTIRAISAGWIFLFMTAAILAGCAAGPKNFGKNKLSDEAAKAFESFQVLPDHTYYYSGSQVSPDAILAVHNSYVMTSDDLWSKTSPDGKQLKFWVESLQKSAANPAYGYFLLTPDGKQIGVIYTRWDPGPVEMGAGNRVSVYLPDKDKVKRSTPRLLRRMLRNRQPPPGLLDFQFSSAEIE